MDACVVEGEGEFGVVGDDDADGEEVVAEVIEACLGEGFFGVAGLGCYGDAFMVVGVVEWIVLRRAWRDGLAGLFGVQRK